ncbi:MAG: hypothetical protein PWP31_1764 [Clostridia bacterium]|nr:hypothetical protein [Clostridia bacterium]
MRQETINALQKIVGENNCKTDEAIRRQHGYSDTAIPDVVVYPQNSQQVADIVKVAYNEGIPVVPWGAGTKARIGLLPQTGGIAVNMTGMNQIVEYDYENQTAYVEAGISYKALQEVLITHNLFWPVEPIESDDCTVGGILVSNAAGPTKLGYGDVKHHLLGLEMVTPTGDIINPGGKTVKNVQDYDNTRFMVGSWGSLGIITKVMLKLKPMPEKETTVFLTFNDIESAYAAVRTIRNETTPLALEMMDNVAMSVMAKSGFNSGGNGVGVMFLYSGFIEQVDVMVDYVQKKFNSAVVLDEKATATAWQARQQMFPVFAGQRGAILATVAVPFTALGRFMRQARAELDKNRKGAAMVAHAGNGQIHVLLDQSPEAYAGVQEIVNRLASLASDVDGLLVVNNITDMTLTRRWVEGRGRAMIDLMARIKSGVDPHHIMAPNSKVLSYVLNGTKAVS